MSKHDVHHFSETRRIRRSAAGKDVRKITKQPWTAQTTAADDDTIAARLTHHAQRVLRFPDVSIAKDRDLHKLLQARDRIPVRVAMIKLGGCSSMQTYRRAAFFLSNATGAQIRHQLFVDTDSELDRDRDVLGICHSRSYDSLKKIWLKRNRGSSATTRNFWHRTTEIHVQM